MGDLIAIMKDGRLVQYDTPERLLAAPTDAFVAEFVGADRALKRLALMTAGEAASPGGPPRFAPRCTIRRGDDTLRDVLSLLLASGADAAAVVDAGGASSGVVSLKAICERAAARTS